MIMILLLLKKSYYYTAKIKGNADSATTLFVICAPSSRNQGTLICQKIQNCCNHSTHIKASKLANNNGIVVKTVSENNTQCYSFAKSMYMNASVDACL